MHEASVAPRDATVTPRNATVTRSMANPQGDDPSQRMRTKLRREKVPVVEMQFGVLARATAAGEGADPLGPLIS